MRLKSEHLARAGENRVPRHFEVSAFEAIGSARRNRGSGWFLIAHAFIIAAKGMIVTDGEGDRGMGIGVVVRAHRVLPIRADCGQISLIPSP